MRYENITKTSGKESVCLFFSVSTLVIANSIPVRLGANAVSVEFPSTVGDDLEDKFDPISKIVWQPSSTFWWCDEGACLWDAGIRDGDINAVDRAGKWRDSELLWPSLKVL